MTQCVYIYAYFSHIDILYRCVCPLPRDSIKYRPIPHPMTIYDMLCRCIPRPVTHYTGITLWPYMTCYTGMSLTLLPHMTCYTGKSITLWPHMTCYTGMSLTLWPHMLVRYIPTVGLAIVDSIWVFTSTEGNDLFTASKLSSCIMLCMLRNFSAGSACRQLQKTNSQVTL